MRNRRRVTHLRSVDERHEVLAKNGILFLDGEIDEGSAYTFCADAMYSRLAGFFNNKPLLVVLNTPGGSIEHGFAIHDCIKSLVESGIQVDVLGLGLVASMGTVIIQAGSRRLSAPNTQFLVHQASQTIGFFKSEEASQLRDRSKELNRLNDIMMRIIAERSGINQEDLKRLCEKTDYWLDAAGARGLGTNGLIDEVTTGPLDFILSKQTMKG